MSHSKATTWTWQSGQSQYPYFRANIPLPESDEDFASAVRHGVSLAKGELAIGLPGFIGPEGKLKQQPD
jgi:hypothetical protein